MRFFRRKPQPRDNRRILVAQEVTITPAGSVLPFDAVTDNLSLGGMFVPTLAPLPEGSEFQFDLALGHQIVSGRARVVWMREFEDGPGRPAGMGALFLDLTLQEERQLSRFIETHIQAGATVQVGAPEVLGKQGFLDRLFGIGAHRAPPSAQPGPRPVTSRRAVVLALLLVLFILAGGLVLAPRINDAVRNFVSVRAGEASQRVVAQLQGPPVGAPGESEGLGDEAPRENRTSASSLEEPRPEPETLAPEPDTEPSPRADRSDLRESLPTRPRLTGIDDILIRHDGGDLVVTLVADGVIERWDHLRLDSGAPRELIRLYGVSRPFGRNRVAVDVPEIRQIRTGYHDYADGDQLHVVLDLADPNVHFVSADEESARLHLRLRRE